jgi:hypothetical protein
MAIGLAMLMVQATLLRIGQDRQGTLFVGIDRPGGTRDGQGKYGTQRYSAARTPSSH